MSTPHTKKPSLWQRFKNLPLVARIAAWVGAGIVGFMGLFLVIGIIASIVDPEGMEEIRAEQEQEREEREAEREAEEQAEREAEEEAQRQAEKEAEAERQAEEEAEAERQAEEEADAEREQEEAEAAAEEEEPETPEGIEGQIARMTDLRGFNDAEVFLFEGDESYPIQSVNVHVEVEPGWSETSMCRNAREQTIRGLQFMRDDVAEDYDEVMFSYTAQSQADATGESSTLGMASLYYDYETVQSINDDAVTMSNVWEAADDGGEGVVCERADDI